MDSEIFRQIWNWMLTLKPEDEAIKYLSYEYEKKCPKGEYPEEDNLWIKNSSQNS